MPMAKLPFYKKTTLSVTDKIQSACLLAQLVDNELSSICDATIDRQMDQSIETVLSYTAA